MTVFHKRWAIMGTVWTAIASVSAAAHPGHEDAGGWDGHVHLPAGIELLPILAVIGLGLAYAWYRRRK